MPKGPIGRIVATIWMYVSVLFIAYFTATITSNLTVQQLKSSIQSVDDLPGKKVATVYGSTAADYLKHAQIDIKEVKQISQAFDALQTGKVDAVVFDSPILLYYAAHEGKGKVDVVGPVFQPERYGILMAFNSPYRKPIDNSLLKMERNGTYKKLYDKWFSTKTD
jgi:polar amino acid transport system substrate-binding protein